MESVIAETTIIINSFRRFIFKVFIDRVTVIGITRTISFVGV